MLGSSQKTGETSSRRSPERSQESDEDGHTTFGSGHEKVQIAVRWRRELQSAEANVVQSFVAQQHALGRADGNQDRAAKHHRVGHFRGRDAEESFNDAIG